MQPELIADYQCACGEGPLWHPLEKKLYWVDIPTGRLFRYEPATGAHETVLETEPIGGFTIQADGALLLFMAKGAVKLWRNGKLTPVIAGLPDECSSRFNDVIADPAGRVFCGTMPSRQGPGRLYRLSTNGGINKVLDGVQCSNGMAFTPDRKRMYYTDSFRHEIYIFDYDWRSGELTNRRLFVRVPAAQGFPDGMTVDAEGRVWSAMWDGHCLIRYSPKGKVLLRVAFPAKKVSSLIFGGADYSDIYVTTAGGNNKQTEGKRAGALFRVRLGIKGVAEFASRIRC